MPRVRAHDRRRNMRRRIVSRNARVVCQCRMSAPPMGNAADDRVTRSDRARTDIARPSRRRRVIAHSRGRCCRRAARENHAETQPVSRALTSLCYGIGLWCQFFDIPADQSATNGAPQARSSPRHRSRKGAGAENPPLAQGERNCQDPQDHDDRCQKSSPNRKDIGEDRGGCTVTECCELPRAANGRTTQCR